MNIIYKTNTDFAHELNLYPVSADFNEEQYKKIADDIMIKYSKEIVNGNFIIYDDRKDYSLFPRSFKRLIYTSYNNIYINLLLDEIVNLIDNDKEINIEIINGLNEKYNFFDQKQVIKYDKIFIKFLEKDKELIKYYKGSNIELLKMIIKKGIKLDDIDTITNKVRNYIDYSEDDLIVFLGVLALYYEKGSLYEIVNMIDNIIIPESIIILLNELYNDDKVNYNIYNKIFKVILNQNIEFMKYYEGADFNYLKLMSDNNIKTNEKHIKYLLSISSFEHFFEDKNKYIYLGFILKHFSNELTLDINNMINNNNHPISENIIKLVGELYNNNILSIDNYEQIFNLILKDNINNIKYYQGFNSNYLKLMVEEGISIDSQYIEKLVENLKSNEFIWLGYNPNNWGLERQDLITYLGLLAFHNNICSKEELFNFINNEISNELIIKFLNKLLLDNQCCIEYYEDLFKILLDKNINIVKYYIGSNIDYLKIMLSQNINISDEQKRNIINNLQTNYYKLSDEDIKIFLEILGVKSLDYYALSFFKGDSLLLVNSFNKLEEFLQLVNIDQESFIQYAFASDINWLEIILNIYNNQNINEFIQIKNYFFKKYYQLDNNSIIEIKYLIDLLKNYNKYPELCLDLLNEDLNDKDISKLKILFDNPSILENIKSKTDLDNIESIIFENYLKEFEKVKYSDNLEDVKNIICMLLFNMDLNEVKLKLIGYGNIKDLRQLLFNNRKNKKIAEDILNMMIYVSIMEDVIDCNNINILKEMIEKILIEKDNELYIKCQKCNMLFRDYDLKMNKLYAREMQVNLTDLEHIPTDLIDEALTDKYGVKVIDLRGYKYCLLEHAKSPRESEEGLINGLSSGNQIAISLSLGSHRNQRLYRNANGSIIFGCCNLNENLFIKSSIANMGSNRIVKKYDYDIASHFSNFRERGALETSSAPTGYNSEILCYRDGLKFQYIILPGGREPTNEELFIAKKYHLTFVKVQKLNTSIENPKEIFSIDYDTKNHQLITGNDDLDIDNIHKMISIKRPNSLKKIAIFTDSHALFEPTLAILEDARRSGVSEIYSLGDNIGTGPNPKEVMDLLEIYGVKSLRGNHELYALSGVESFREHLNKTNSFSNAQSNSLWTKTQLTEKQIELIRKMPDDMIIEIGGKKVMLSHYIKNYNTDEEREIPSDVTEVFQGHVHFAKTERNLITLRGAGIGNTGNESTASYVILTEKEEGGYDIEYRNIKYDLKSSKFDIIESDMDKLDKDKIERWIGGKSK